MSWRAPFLEGIAAGRPVTGPASVHVDLTNTCNAACVTCWDHSPLLTTPRTRDWKRRRLPMERFRAIVADLAGLGSVRHVVLSGMGEPLTHPDAYDMIALCRDQGWSVTLITNLVAADPARLIAAGPEQLLVGVQGVTPDVYTAFHPGWTEAEFFRMCATLRALARSPIRVRHVQVIDRHTAPQVPEMVRFGRSFGADRVNFKLASLAGGTEATGITDDQRAWLLAEGIPRARALAASLGVATNVGLFEAQVRAGGRATAPLEAIDCHMGTVFARITVDEEVLYCCNVEVRVGSLRDGSFGALWFGEAWQAMRDRLRGRGWFPGCERCGKLEQNAKWTALARAGSADDRELLEVEP